MNTHIAEEYRQQAEALAEVIAQNIEDEEGCILRDSQVENWSAKIATALQAAETGREWQPIETAKKEPRSIQLWCVMKGVNGTLIGRWIAEGRFEIPHCTRKKAQWCYVNDRGWSVAIEDGWKVTHWMEWPAAPHTPRNAQQSEAVIADAVRLRDALWWAEQCIATMKEYRDNGEDTSYVLALLDDYQPKYAALSPETVIK